MNILESISHEYGHAYHESITGYSLHVWRSAGGMDGNEPYFEEGRESRGLNSCPVIRVYVDARLFSTWENWKEEAERAKLGAIKGTDHRGEPTFFIGPGGDFSGDPAFIVELIPGIGTRLWINVLCPSESEFYRAKAAAEAEAADRERWEKDSSIHATDLQHPKFTSRTTKYCSLLNRRSDLQKQIDRWGVR